MSPGHPLISIALTLDRLTTKEVLGAVLHSVLFHRLLGTVKPGLVDVLDVTMPIVDDPETKTLVQEKVDAFWRGMEGGSNKKGQVIITFSEKRPKKSWFIMGEEDVPWEQWSIDVEIKQPTTERERQRFNADLASALTKSLQTMLTHTSSDRGRAVIPLINNATDISPFPYKIAVKVGGVELS